MVDQNNDQFKEMKAFVSYVLQDHKGHEHLSEVVEIKEPPYTYSTDPPISQVMKWAHEKQRVTPEKQVIIISMYKL